MKIFSLLRAISPVCRLGCDTSQDLIESSQQMTREEIEALFVSLNPWFLDRGFKADTHTEDGQRVLYIPLLEDCLGVDGRFGTVCYVRYNRTTKSYQLVTFEEGRKRLDAHEAREYQAWVDDCANGHDGEA